MENLSIKFTVGIPAFKIIFLHDCIESILHQTYSNFEIIIFDDCSPDPINTLIENIGDKRVMYFRNDFNIGAENVVNNWNKCLEMASGEYFILMGDDDIMTPTYLEEFLNLIDKYPNIDVYHCKSLIIDDKNRPLRFTNSWPEFETVYENIYHRIMNLRQQYVSDWVYRTSVLKGIGGFFFMPLAWSSDDITAYLAAGTKGIAHTQKPLLHYRQSQYTISMSGNVKLKMKAILLEELWLNKFLAIKPMNSDLLYYENIKDQLSNFVRLKKNLTISLSLKQNRFKLKEIVFWLYNKNSFGLSYTDLIISLLKSFK